MTNTITDFDIQALIDNELAWEEAKFVRAYIENHDWARERYEELLIQKRALQSWWTQENIH